MWQELTRSTALLTVAALFLLLGFFLWRVNAALKHAFRHRENNAENLRRAGRADEADRVAAETRALARRLPRYGRILVVAGLALGVIGLLRLR